MKVKQFIEGYFMLLSEDMSQETFAEYDFMIGTNVSVINVVLFNIGEVKRRQKE